MAMEQVSFDVDSVLFEILSGAGVAGDSRDLTVVDQTDSEFDDDATDVLSAMETQVEKTGADFMFLSSDVALKLRQHAQFKEISSNGVKSRISEGHLVDVLREHLMINEVVIGNRLYQDGSAYFALDLQHKAGGICYLGAKSNLLAIPWMPLEADEYEDESKRQVYVRAETHLDLVIADPALSVAFTNILS